MIPLTRPDGSTLLVNPNRIETVEQTPDTVITLADGKKLLVRESAAEVSARFLAHQRAVHAMSEGLRDPAEGEATGDGDPAEGDGEATGEGEDGTVALDSFAIR